MNNKRLSPFNFEFWVRKGYTLEDAIFKANSIRPIKKEYWITKGYSEEESIILAEQTKLSNNKKGAKKSSSRDKKEFKKNSPRCKEYWLEKGYTEEESKLKVKETQTTFSLEKMILKYGLIKGTSIWENRQIEWQKTLKNKSEKEIKEINKKKKPILLNDTIEKCVTKYNKSRNMNLVSSIEEFVNMVQKDLKDNPNKIYMPYEKYIENIPKIQIEILKELNYNIKEIKQFFKESDYVFKIKNQSYRMWVNNTHLLRSSYEIYFYEKFYELYPNTEILIDKCYPNSSFRYDFKILNDYIEICPMIHTNKKYAEKMLKKQKLFGCILLSTIKEIDYYLKEKLCKLQ